MRNIFICVGMAITLIVFPGCIASQYIKSNQGIPKGDKGSASQSTQDTKKIYGSIVGEVELPEMMLFTEDGKPYPPMRIKVDGVDAELPAGTKGKLSVRTYGSETSEQLTEILSQWKVNSAPFQLFMFGSIMVAAGIAMSLFGLMRMGIVVSGGGLGLIGCGIVINQYPWVALIAAGIGVLSAGIYFYSEYKKRKINNELSNYELVLSKLTMLIEHLPKDVKEQFIKDPLKEDDNSKLIRDIIQRAKGKD